MRISDYRIPGRQEFMMHLLQALFPDVPDITDITRYHYADLCRVQADRFFGAPVPAGHAGRNYLPAEHMDLNRFAWHLCEFEHRIFGSRLKEYAGDIVDLYDYRSSLGSLTEGTSSSYDNWLKPDKEPASTPRRAFNKPFRMALFFGWLLLNCEECAVSRIRLYRYCLECLGITDEDGLLTDAAFTFDWSENGHVTRQLDAWSHKCSSKKAARDRHRCEELSFPELGNRDILGCGLVLLAMFEMIGAPDPDRIAAVQRELRLYYKEEFQRTDDLLAAKAALEQAEQAFFGNIRAFIPRALSGVAVTRIEPADLFVLQDFSNHDCSVRLPSPAQRLPGAKKSVRSMLVAGTGMGKSFYLQMLALCGLHKKYGEEADAKSHAALDLLAEKIYGTEKLSSGSYAPEKSVSGNISDGKSLPVDLCILSVPGRMFTFCYRRAEYRAWTGDFTALFTNCMWNFAGSFNFFTTEDSEKFMPDTAPDPMPPAILRELPRYLKTLAAQGRLLLLLDSFDEIPSGEMREAYFRALAAFRQDYCWIPAAVGAHILLSTREMSPDTMRTLCEELQIRPEQDLFRIAPLDQRRMEQLVENWSEQLSFTADARDSLLYNLNFNHFFREYASTPYMLSTVCARRDHNFTFIASAFIQDLMDRVKNHYPRYVRSCDEQDIREIRAVLDQMPVVLADLALGTIGEQPPHLSLETLDKRLEEALAAVAGAGRLQMPDRKRILKKLYEILVTEVGVIVPAEGSDRDFQFMNHIIRCELAADGLWNLRLKDSPEAYRSALRPLMRHAGDFVGFLIPLLCKIGLENPALSESLIYALTTFDTSSCEDPLFTAPENADVSRKDPLFAVSENETGFSGEIFSADAGTGPLSAEEILLTAMADLAAERYGSCIVNVRRPGARDAQYVYAAQKTLILRLLSSPSFHPTDREKEELRQSAAFLNVKDAIIPALAGVLDPPCKERSAGRRQI